jgi:hypothetical protein
MFDVSRVYPNSKIKIANEKFKFNQALFAFHFENFVQKHIICIIYKNIEI